MITSMQTHLIAQKISKLSSFYSLSTLLFFSFIPGFSFAAKYFLAILANTLSPFFVLQSATLKMRLLLKSKTRLTRLAYGRKSWRLHIQKNLFREIKNLTRMRTFSFFRFKNRKRKLLSYKQETWMIWISRRNPGWTRCIITAPRPL